MSLTLPNNGPRQIMTVLGPVPYDCLGITDAHNHVWIEAVLGASQDSPVLIQYEHIRKELIEYRKMGGETILDCQPGGCGRDGKKLVELSMASKVDILACTGFHRRKYYPPNYWLWGANDQNICDYLCSELNLGLTETMNTTTIVRAGFIKIALESNWIDCPQPAIEGAAYAACKTKALMEIHTEKGALAEKACNYFMEKGVQPNQLVFCHMDKRPDISLHLALANLGVLLEYDTFYRPKYDPITNLWPLIERMVSEGFSTRIALATDMAEATLYRHIGGGPGLQSLPGEIQEQLKLIGVTEPARKQLLGGNIARRLAGIN
jgi:5-phospho-D-xylono-1,4-lactonase